MGWDVILAPSRGERDIDFLPGGLGATCSPSVDGGMLSRARGCTACVWRGPASTGCSSGLLGAKDCLPGRESQFETGEGPSACALLQVDGKETLLPQRCFLHVPKGLVGSCSDPPGQLCGGVSEGAGAAPPSAPRVRSGQPLAAAPAPGQGCGCAQEPGKGSAAWRPQSLQPSEQPVARAATTGSGFVRGWEKCCSQQSAVWKHTSQARFVPPRAALPAGLVTS